MRIRLGSMELSESAYLEVLQTACRALQGRDIAPPVERIEILRLDGEAGWQFEPADRCSDVLPTPPEGLARIVAGASRPIRPKPSPAAALRDAR